MCDSRGDHTRADGSDQRRELPQRRSRMPGMAPGTAAPSSMTARRSARRKRRMPHRFAPPVLGGHSPARPTAERASAGDGVGRAAPRAADATICAAVHAALRQARPTIPATSRAICRACAKTAGNIPTPRSGSAGAFAHSAMAIAPGAPPHAQSDQSHAHTRVDAPNNTRSNPTSSQPTSTTCRRTSARGWTWYTGSAAGCTASRSRHILGLRLRGKQPDGGPLHSEYVEWFFDDLPPRGHHLPIEVENPDNVSRGVCTLEVDGKLLDEPAIAAARRRERAQVRVVLGSRAESQRAAEAMVVTRDVGRVLPRPWLENGSPIADLGTDRALGTGMGKRVKWMRKSQ